MKETILKRSIKNYLYLLSDQVAKNNAIGLLDINKNSEDLVAELLNEIFDYKLDNANKIKSDYPGIDLIDESNNLAVQVTSTTRPDKVKHTFITVLSNKHRFKKPLERIILYYLKNKSVNITKSLKTSIDNILSNYLYFNFDTDIFNNSTILNYINPITDLEKIITIERLLAERLALPNGGKMDPIRGYIIPKRLNSYAGYSIHDLVGRNNTLELIFESFQKQTITLLTGLGGIGKTTIARAYLEKFKDEYEHLAYVDVSTNIIESLLQGLAIVDKSFEVNYDLSSLQNLRILIDKLRTIPNTILVIDNCNDELELREIKTVLESLEWKILITSRTHPQSYAKEIIEIAPLHSEDALLLFTKFYSQFSPNDTPTINQIISKAHFHTKLIILLAKAASNNPLLKLDTLADKVAENAYNEESININVDLNTEEQSVYEFILALFEPEKLTVYSKHYLRLFSVLPNVEIPINYLFELFEREENQSYFVNTLNKLVASGWIEKYSNEYYRIHPLIQLVTQRKLQPTPSECLSLIKNIMHIMDTSIDALSLYSYLDYCESIVAYFHNNPYKEIALMFNMMSHVYRTSAQYTKLIEANFSALNILKIIQPPFPEAEAQSYGNLMKSYNLLGKYAEAIEYGKQSIEIQERFLNPMHHDLAATYSDLSNTFRNNEQSDLAYDYIIKAINIQRWIYYNRYSIRDAYNLIMSYKTLAALMADSGNQMQNIKIIERALFIGYRTFLIAKRALPANHYLFGGIFNDISLTLRDLCCLDKSMDYLTKATKINEDVLPDNHPELALNYYNMAILYKRMKEVERAIYYAEKALSIQENIFSSNHTNIVSTKELLNELYTAM